MNEGKSQFPPPLIFESLAESREKASFLGPPVSPIAYVPSLLPRARHHSFFLDLARLTKGSCYRQHLD